MSDDIYTLVTSYREAIRPARVIVADHVAMERRQLPGLDWVARDTTYDGMGQVSTVSEWCDESVAGTPALTQYLGYDAFGRPGTLRPPDGSSHDVTMSYTGDRVVQRTVKIATSQTGETGRDKRHGKKGKKRWSQRRKILELGLDRASRRRFHDPCQALGDESPEKPPPKASQARCGPFMDGFSRKTVVPSGQKAIPSATRRFVRVETRLSS